MSVSIIRYTVPLLAYYQLSTNIIHRSILLLSIGWLFITGNQAFAHEVPDRVYVQAIVSVENTTLDFLVRVPLSAMRDFNFPLTSAGKLDITKLDIYLQDAAILWVSDYTEFYENGIPLTEPIKISTRISHPSDRSFSSFTRARAHINSLDDLPELTQNQALLDIHFVYSVRSQDSVFSIRPALAHLGRSTEIVLRYLTADGREHLYTFHATNDRVQLDPGFGNVSLYFVEAGFLHILGGADHLLFLLCLLIPVRRIRSLFFIITAFTLAHSITLAASALQLLPQANGFPIAVEVLIAISIVYMALENCVRSNFEWRWLVALGFGLIHGFGFSYALSESLQYSGSHLLTALFAFNLGVELGQLLFVATVLILIRAIAPRLRPYRRVLTIIASVLIAHTAWHWTLERIEVLAQFPLALPQADTILLAETLRWCILGLVVALLAWVFGILTKRFSQ